MVHSVFDKDGVFVANVVLTLDLFMYHQGKMVSLQDARQLSQIIVEANLSMKTKQQFSK